MNTQIINLCPTCKYLNKCKRLHKIQKQLISFVMDVLEDWEINMDIKYIVQDCPRYNPDLEALMQEDGYLEDGEDNE